MIKLSVSNKILYQELSDTVRLFFGTKEVVNSSMGDDYDIKVDVNDSQTMWYITVTFVDDSFRYEYKKEEYADDIIYKRMLRRHSKTALYYSLKKRLGTKPSWGALTGIRPTKLIRQLAKEKGSLIKAKAVLSDEMDVSRDKIELLSEILDTQHGLYDYGNDDAMDIYVGIPYCSTKCLYCSFASMDLSKCRKDNRDEYTNALIAEIASSKEYMLNRNIRSIYVGGGTPTALGMYNLQMVLETITSTFPEFKGFSGFISHLHHQIHILTGR